MPSLRRVPKIYQLRDSSQRSSSTKKKTSNQNSNNNRLSSEPQSTNSYNHLLVKPNQFSFIGSANSSLLKLPAELIFEIAQILLSPSFTIQRWDHSTEDLLNFSSTCKRIRSITSSLLFNQVTIVINSNQFNLSRAFSRIRKLGLEESRRPQPRIKKLIIKDDGLDFKNVSQERQSWYSYLRFILINQLKSIEFLCYSRNLEAVTEKSPYDLLTIDQNLLVCCLNDLKNLNSLYLSGLETKGRKLSTRTSTASNSSIKTLHLIGVDDSILPLIKHCTDLKDLRIWRDFLVSFPSVDHWLSIEQWSSLQTLKLKGFYGNSVRELQSSLRKSCRSFNNSFENTMKLHTLDLDEPYSTNDALSLLEAFKSSVITTLRLTVWRDYDFGPSLFKEIAEKFPNLEDFQIVLETPLRRWWPHKLNTWAESLSNFKKLKKITWNCSPFTCHDFIHVQAGMKSQVVVLGRSVPTLERVSYIDISGWLEIERKPTEKNSTTRSAIKSIKWAGVKFTYPFLTCVNFFDNEEEEEEDPILHEEEDEDESPTKTTCVQNRPSGEEPTALRGGSRSEFTNDNQDHRLDSERPKKKPLYDPFSADSSASTSASSLTSTLSLLSSSCSSSLPTFAHLLASKTFSDNKSPKPSSFSALTMSLLSSSKQLSSSSTSSSAPLPSISSSSNSASHQKSTGSQSCTKSL